MIFLKVFGDVCLCFSVIDAFPGLFAHAFSFLWPAGLCGAGAGLAAWFTARGWGRLRFLAALLPLFALALARGPMEALVLLPALLYGVTAILRGRLSMEYFSFRARFLRSLIPWAVFYCMIWVLDYVTSLLQPGGTGMDPSAALGRWLLYAASGVLLLRRLRMGEEDGAQHRALGRRQLAGALALLSGTVLAVLALGPALQEGLAFLLNLPFQAAGVLLGGLGELAEQIPPAPGGLESTLDDAIPSQTPPSGPVRLPEIEAVESAVQSAKSSFPWLAVALILTALLLMLFWLLRSLRPAAAPAASREVLERAEPAAPRAKQRLFPSNRDKVRHYYRQFLKEEQKRGFKRRISHTSADILHGISPQTDPRAASDLREIYLRARYDEGSGVTREQAGAARDALRRSRR